MHKVKVYITEDFCAGNRPVIPSVPLGFRKPSRLPHKIENPGAVKVGRTGVPS